MYFIHGHLAVAVSAPGPDVVDIEGAVVRESLQLVPDSGGGGAGDQILQHRSAKSWCGTITHRHHITQSMLNRAFLNHPHRLKDVRGGVVQLPASKKPTVPIAKFLIPWMSILVGGGGGLGVEEKAVSSCWAGIPPPPPRGWDVPRFKNGR